MTAFKPRPSQQKIVDALLSDRTHRRLGVSAVPGSGKTHILSYLTAELIPHIDEEQEVLVVTLVNAAVDNFRRRVNEFIRQKGLLPGLNYRVCTLHSLAHEIVRQRPALVGLSHDFQILDDRAAAYIRREVVEAWLAGNRDLLEGYLADVSDPRKVRNKDLPELALSIAERFIKEAKDRRLTPRRLEDALYSHPAPLPLARFGVEVYRDYQARLARVGVDFDDLIRLAADALDFDPDFLARLQQRWPYILEDEAQDSSRLQQTILDRLAGDRGVWVRVGDPNQAIYETFTTAAPHHLRDFLARPDVLDLPMPEAGRSSASIIALANHLIDWTMQAHPLPDARDALQPPYIRPTPPGDPQPNPPDCPDRIVLHPEKFSSEKEINTVVRSVKKWLAENPDKSVAILDAQNRRGAEVVSALRRAGVDYVELLRSTASTRSAAEVLAAALSYLARPDDSNRLVELFSMWRRDTLEQEAYRPLYEWITTTLSRCRRLEDYLWPGPGEDWLETQLSTLSEEAWAAGTDPEEDESIRQIRACLEEFRTLVRRWQAASVLPVDQLVLLLAQDLFSQPADLALAHKFALVLRQTADENPAFRLAQFADLLAEIASNRRRFLGFDEEDSGFEPPKGKVTVATMHRAKGLEWDRVYLLGVNDYSFPSGQAGEGYYSEKWFVRDALNLEAEALGQLDALVRRTPYREGTATEQARIGLVKERLRLLYVGLTRARQELVVTWNTGRPNAGRSENRPALPFLALSQWWKDRPEAGKEGNREQ